ncbi:MAG: ferrochelatase [Myxococcota bacterium]|nr:ferrochelatase [Myxococcota bacterium]
MATASPVGVVLINVGTPDAPRTNEVRRYLGEFLMDPKVLDIPTWKRWLLVHGIILRTRPKKSAEAYAKVWTQEGSPLLVFSQRAAAGVQALLGPDFLVRVGMRYGNPSLLSVVRDLRDRGVKRIVGVPMYPQYSEAATGSSMVALADLARRAGIDDLRFVPPFFGDAEFIAAFAEVATPVLWSFQPDMVLFSYHGLPERQVRESDPTRAHCFASPDCCAQRVAANVKCYRSHCHHTTMALAKTLGLASDRVMMSFQSRLGRDPWVKPYTDIVLPELAARGVKRLAVMCPAFVADCLETLEEVGMRGREQWLSVGGEDLVLVPSLNDHPRWLKTVEAMVRSLAVG